MLMQNQKVYLFLINIIVVSFLTVSVTHAAEKNKDAKRNAKIIQQFRKQQAELQAQLDAEKQTLADKEKELEDASKKASATMSSLNKMKAELAKANEVIAEKNTEIEQVKTKLNEQKLEHEKALLALASNEQQRKTLSQNVALTRTQLTECKEKNQLLYTYAKSLIKIYEKPSVYDSVMREESFFQLKRVELENILQDKFDEIENAIVNVN
jgi:chromosome segregation ATPase